MWLLRDGSTFRGIEKTWPIFKEETLNVRLSMLVDGVNIFGEIRTSYYVFLWLLKKNNIPPWMSIKL